jgi:hypothetical protein
MPAKAGIHVFFRSQSKDVDGRPSPTMTLKFQVQMGQCLRGPV